MTRRERLLATLRGESVDRPAVNFYELNGLDQDPSNEDPFNVFSHPSWAPLLDLAREKTDLILMRGVSLTNAPPDPVAALSTSETHEADGSRFSTRTIQAGKRVLRSRSRRDRDINTTWVLEHLLKDRDDLEAYLALPTRATGGEPNVEPVLAAEEKLGDRGLVMIDTGDPICSAASMFHMEDYTVMALTEPALFHRLLERIAEQLYPRIEAAAKALPGRLWRIYGPEYASPPYLPPRLFDEYVVRYTKPLVEMIQRHGGYARIHSHGRLRDILHLIAATGCQGLDPIEPPPQGDMELAEVRQQVGRQMVLFGNLEASDLQGLDAKEFEGKVRQALRQGTAGEGRGFVLMPSSCPYGREVSARTIRNYEMMVELTEAWEGE